MLVWQYPKLHLLRSTQTRVLILPMLCADRLLPPNANDGYLEAEVVLLLEDWPSLQDIDAGT